MPVPVEKPECIRFHCISVLVPVPAVVSVRSVLDIEDRMPEARFPVSRVAGLWLCHAAAKESQVIGIFPLHRQKGNPKIRTMKESADKYSRKTRKAER